MFGFWLFLSRSLSPTCLVGQRRRLGDRQGPGRVPGREDDPRARRAERHPGQGPLPVEGQDPGRVGHRQPEEPRRQERRRLAAAGQHECPKAKLAKNRHLPWRRQAQAGRATSSTSRAACSSTGSRWPASGDTIVVKNSAPVAAQLLLGQRQQRRVQPDHPEDGEWKMPRRTRSRKGRRSSTSARSTLDDRLRPGVRPPVLRGHRRGREVRDQERPGREVPDRLLARERATRTARRVASASRSRSRPPGDRGEADRVRREPEEAETWPTMQPRAKLARRRRVAGLRFAAQLRPAPRPCRRTPSLIVLLRTTVLAGSRR